MDAGVYYYLDVVRSDTNWRTPGDLVAVELSTGRVLWRTHLPDAVGRFVVIGDTVVVVSSRITGISRITGRIAYRNHPCLGRDACSVAKKVDWEIQTCGGMLFVEARSGIELLEADTGLTKELLRFPTSKMPHATDRGTERSLFCSGSRLLLESRQGNGDREVFLRVGRGWMQVGGLSDGAVTAFRDRYLILQSKDGMGGYVLPPQ